MGAEAPAGQGARSAHTGCMKATSNAAPRDASAARVVQLFPDRPLGEPGRRRGRKARRIAVSQYRSMAARVIEESRATVAGAAAGSRLPADLAVRYLHGPNACQHRTSEKDKATSSCPA